MALKAGTPFFCKCFFWPVANFICKCRIVHFGEGIGLRFAVHVAEFLKLNAIKEPSGINSAADHTPTQVNNLWKDPVNRDTVGERSSKFMVIGHRGCGMNKALSPDKRMQAIKENTLTSFNLAGKHGVGFVEFDVQVTKDNHAVIFHDNFIVTEEDGVLIEKRISDITIDEFLSYGLQKDGKKVGKPLFRKLEDGQFTKWNVLLDDCLCTLQEAFEKVDQFIGFNIELKFDDDFQYPEEQIRHIIQVIVKDVYENAQGREIFFSSFHPDAAHIVRKEQTTYPVLFLTDGGTSVYNDFRRNSLDAAIEVCLAGGLQGIVSEVKAIFGNPGSISRMKSSNLCLFTYGQLNNVVEAVYIQHLLGVNGVIVDFVREIAAAVAQFSSGDKLADLHDYDSQISFLNSLENQGQLHSPPKFSSGELSFILSLITQLIQK